MKPIWSLLPLLALSACHPPELRVVAVEPLGLLPKPDSSDGRDGGLSGQFLNHSVWVYGDSVALMAGTFPSTWRNNTMSWTDDLDATDGIGGFVQPLDTLGTPREFFPRTADEEAFNAAHIDRGDGNCQAPCGARYAIWGSAPITNPGGAGVLLAYSKVYSEPGEFNFSIVGSSLATWTDFDTGPVRPEVDGRVADKNILFDASDGEFGIPTVFESALYLFSCSGQRSPHGECRLARAPLDQVFHRDAWRFWTGSAWSADVAAAASLFAGTPNMTVHWNAYLNRWLVIYASYGHIMVRTAPRPEGPWTDQESVYTPPEPDILHALGHAEYQQADGAVEYVSYLSGQFRLVRLRLSRP